jgi:hypothetical protein
LNLLTCALSPLLGFAYEYVSPDNLQLPTAVVVDGVFAPTRQRFKVLVVRILEFLTVPGVKKLREYARAGLPIIFDGGVPTRMWAAHECASKQVSAVMHDLAELENVHVITGAGLADTILSLGIEPLTKISSNGSWYTVWREDTINNIDYVFVYNENGTTTTGTIEFASTKIPYLYDIWSGKQFPLMVYEKTATKTIIPFTLHGNQSNIVAFLPEPINAVPTTYVTSSPSGVLSISASNQSISVKAGANGQPLSVKTSDGQTHAVAGSVAKPFGLTNWNLTVEHWDPPENFGDVAVTARKSNTTHNLPTLVTWNKIPDLENVSGRGYYTAKFQWPPTQTAVDGAFIDVGRIFQTLTLTVNGNRLPPLDPSEGRADIGPYLKTGENEVHIAIATTLINALRPVWYDMRFSATVPEPPNRLPPAQVYGLKSPVTITPYKETIIGV